MNNRFLHPEFANGILQCYEQGKTQRQVILEGPL